MNISAGQPRLTIIYNNNPELEFDRNKKLPDHQELYLDKMDEKMIKGITIGDRKIDNPDKNQRAQFVAANLTHALRNNNEPMMASLCSYLAMRLPDLQQVTINEKNGGMEIDFNFDKPYTTEILVAPPTKAKQLPQQPSELDDAEKRIISQN